MKGFKEGSVPFNFYTDMVELGFDTKPYIKEPWEVTTDDIIAEAQNEKLEKMIILPGYDEDE